MGMVKLGPDLYTGSDSYSGYQPSGEFLGFSLLLVVSVSVVVISIP